MSLCLEPRTLFGLGKVWWIYEEPPRFFEARSFGQGPTKEWPPSRRLSFACSKGMPERIKLCAYEINPNWLKSWLAFVSSFFGIFSFFEATLMLELECSDFESLAGLLALPTPPILAGTCKKFWVCDLSTGLWSSSSSNVGIFFSIYKNNTILCPQGNGHNSPSCKCGLCLLTSFQRGWYGKE